jgi:hypothetical protein
LARLRLDPNPAAMHLNDALGYGQTQAGAAFLAGDGVVRLLKLLKQGPLSPRERGPDLVSPHPPMRSASPFRRRLSSVPTALRRGSADRAERGDSLKTQVTFVVS